MAYQYIKQEAHGRVGMVILHRPQAFNALCTPLVAEIIQAVTSFEHDPAIGCLVLTGSEKAFAAGADINEMQGKSFPGIYLENMFAAWHQVAELRKPIIAAVAGFALGGGCELAMMCDFIIAADNARFGQPEVDIGIMPSAGGTQRLTRLIGRAKTMEMCLTGRMMGAVEAEQCGLVARVVPLADLAAETMKVARQIASKSLPATMMVKESIRRADEVSLAEGLRFERHALHSMFALYDQREGMAAFVEKRKPSFKHE